VKILSIDLGSSSIKAVEFESSFGRLELADYKIVEVTEPAIEAASVPAAEVVASAGEGAAESGSGSESKDAANSAEPPKRQLLTAGQIAAIRQIFREKDYKYDKLVVNVPRAWATSRVFHFPTKDRKVIQSSLVFELEDDIPFDLEKVTHDFAILNYDGHQSTIFTAVIQKNDLRDTISELQMIGLDPDVITTEPWALSQLLRRTIPVEYRDRPFCVVNLGAKQTGIHMFLGEGPVLSLSCPAAGDDLTRAIAQNYGLTFDQAEKAKIEGGFVLTKMHLSEHAATITKEQEKFSGVITDALVPIVREIKQALISYKAQTKLVPKAIFLTGGTSQLPNLQLYLEEILQIPVFQTKYMSQLVGDTLRLAESTESQIAVATGLAVSSIKAERFATINFRKDEFVKNRGWGSLSLKHYKRPLMFAAASLGFVYANIFAQWLILNRREAQQEQTLERSIKGVVGAVSPSVLRTYIVSPSVLRNDIKKEFAKYEQSNVVSPSKKSLSGFDLLNMVSKKMPRDVVIDVTQFDFKEEKLLVKGYLAPESSVDRLQGALDDTGVLTGVAVVKQEMVPKLGKRYFEITASVKGENNVETR